jgi:hypothetical protein
MARSREQLKWEQIGKLRGHAEAIETGKTDIVTGVGGYAAELATFDVEVCDDNVARSDSELKGAKVPRYDAREMRALRWVGRGGDEGVLTRPSGPPENTNEINNLKPALLGEIWQTTYPEKLTAKGFYEAMARATRKEVIAAYTSGMDRKEAAQLALPKFEEETAQGWIVTHEANKTDAAQRLRDLSKALKQAISEEDFATIGKIERDLKAQLKAIHEDRRIREEEKRIKAQTKEEQEEELSRRLAAVKTDEEYV